MENPATKPVPEWNEFSEYLRDNPGVFVKLRNGCFVQPKFEEAEDEYCVDVFVAPDHCWDVKGRSLRSRDFDMMSLEKS